MSHCDFFLDFFPLTFGCFGAFLFFLFLSGWLFSKNLDSSSAVDKKTQPEPSKSNSISPANKVAPAETRDVGVVSRKLASVGVAAPLDL